MLSIGDRWLSIYSRLRQSKTGANERSKDGHNLCPFYLFASLTNQIARRLGDNNKSVDLINYSLAFLNEMDVMASIDDILLRIDRIALFHKYVRKSTRLSSRHRSIYFLLILFVDISSRVSSPRGFAQSGGLNRSSQYISFLTSHRLSCSLVG